MQCTVHCTMECAMECAMQCTISCTIQCAMQRAAYPQVCSLLLARGLDPNIMAGSGGSPLMIAARAGAGAAVKVLGAGTVSRTISCSVACTMPCHVMRCVMHCVLHCHAPCHAKSCDMPRLLSRCCSTPARRRTRWASRLPCLLPRSRDCRRDAIGLQPGRPSAAGKIA